MAPEPIGSVVTDPGGVRVIGLRNVGCGWLALSTGSRTATMLVGLLFSVLVVLLPDPSATPAVRYLHVGMGVVTLLVLPASLLVHRRTRRHLQVPIAVSPHHVEIDGERFAWEDTEDIEWTQTRQRLLVGGAVRAWTHHLTAAQCDALARASAAGRVDHAPRAVDAERQLTALTSRLAGSNPRARS